MGKKRNQSQTRGETGINYNWRPNKGNQSSFVNAIKHTKADVIGTGPAGCVDKDTEYFTGNGWKPISEYIEGYPVGVIDPNTKELIIENPGFVKYPSTGFNHIKAQGLDMMLCDEHTIAYLPAQNQNRSYMSINCADMLEKHVASKLCGWAGKIPTSFKGVSFKGIDMTEGELRLQVAVMADGRVVREGKDNYTQMRFRKKRKYDRLIEMCKRYNLKYSDRGSNGTEYQVIVWPTTKEKTFTPRYWDCSNVQLAIIIDEVKHWDASITKTSCFRYSSKYYKDCEFIQFAAASQGFNTNLYKDERIDKVSYCMDATIRSTRSFANKDRKLNIPKVSNGKYKYCFTTSTGFWLARRNGSIFVTGNCGKTFLAINAALDAYEDNQIDQIILCRPAEGPCKTLGFTKGSTADKMAGWVMPLLNVMYKRYGRLNKGIVNFMIEREDIILQPLDQIMGMDISDAWLICDEVQLMNVATMKSLVTRVNESGKLILTGDIRQSLMKGDSGLKWLMDKMDNHDGFGFTEIEFDMDDCVRSGRVKQRLLDMQSDGEY